MDNPTPPPTFPTLPDDGGVPIIPTPPSEIVSKPASKGMGWKRTVATVLGLVLLVGGIGAGIVLIRQPQIFSPKAVCSCYPSDESHCKGDWFQVDGCTCMGTKNCPDENTPKPKDTSNPGCTKGDKDQCCPGDEMCQGEGGNLTGYNCTCVGAGKNNYLWRCTDYDTHKCATDNAPPAGSYKCDDGVTKVKVSGNCLVSSNSETMNRYTCPDGTDMAGGCSANPENFTTKSLCADKPDSNFCGTVQIDYGQHPSGCSVSRKFPCSSSKPTTKPKATATPAPTPPLCEAVKAYTDTTWVQLSAAELAALKPGAKIHFAVSFTNGNTGTIDKAKFTINNVEGSEVTTKHGSLFYVDFTVPTGTLNFSVSAKLHSTVYGWF